jgi:hypothetical protein
MQLLPLNASESLNASSLQVQYKFNSAAPGAVSGREAFFLLCFLSGTAMPWL